MNWEGGKHTHLLWAYYSIQKGISRPDVTALVDCVKKQVTYLRDAFSFGISFKQLIK